MGNLDPTDGAVGDENGVRVMEAALEVSGAGIVLLDNFWRTASQLILGATLQGVLGGKYSAGASRGQ